MFSTNVYSIRITPRENRPAVASFVEEVQACPRSKNAIICNSFEWIVYSILLGRPSDGENGDVSPVR